MIDEFKSYPLWKKGLILLGLPFVILFLLVRGASSISALFNSAERESTDTKSAELDKKIQATSGEIAKQEGRLDQLEESKNEDIKAQESASATDFYNNRNKPSK
jgi:hypothetical protein